SVLRNLTGSIERCSSSALTGPSLPNRNRHAYVRRRNDVHDGRTTRRSRIGRFPAGAPAIHQATGVATSTAISVEIAATRADRHAVRATRPLLLESHDHAWNEPSSAVSPEAVRDPVLVTTITKSGRSSSTSAHAVGTARRAARPVRVGALEEPGR